MSPGGGDKHKTRTLIVHKDDGGYGLTLSGDKPTRVQTVRTSGASHRAGVREGDVIIKVNGQQVTESDHNEVVKLIQTGSYVALTVIHTSRILEPSGRSHEPAVVGGGDRRESSAARSPTTTSITSPVPASEAVLKKTQTNNQATLQLMLEEKTREIEELKSQLVRSNSKKLRNKLEIAESIQADLQNKIRLSTLEFSEPRFGPLPPTPTHGGTTPLTPSSGSAPSSRLSSVCGDVTPVAPPRSESLTFSAAAEAPPLPARNTAPTPPPRNPVVAGLPPPPPKMPRHSSHENINQTGGVSRRSSAAAQPSPARDTVHHTRTRSSPCSLEQTLEVAASMEAITPRYETPPGTPPPPYNAPADPALVTWGGLTAGGGGGGADIMTMEDESDDDDAGASLQSPALPPEGDHGPFNSLTELLQHGAHLAVFLNYVISNADPAPLLFFLITDAYKQGTPKEMRKWAYEIHSCFLVPRAPLEIPNLDTQVITHIDTFLAEVQEREESLLKLFWKVRSKARDKLKFQLDAFRAKRALGMGNIFGPSDPELKAAEENPIKRNQIIEDTLLPLFDTMADDFENATDRQSTLCSSLATVLVKTFSIRSTQALANIEKIPMFVSKEKRRERLFGRVLKKNLTVKGHNFYLRHYDQVTMCTQSHEIIWGIGPQGYRCQNCDFDVHKKIVHQVEEACVGPNKEQPKNKKIRNSLINLGFPSRLSDVGRIMSKDQLTVLEKDRKTSSVSPSASMRGPADLPSNFRSYTSELSTPEDQTDQSVAKLPPEVERGGSSGGSAGSRLGETSTRSDLWSSRPEKTSSIKRSESAKDGNKRQQTRPYTRKHSDPSLGQKSNRLSLEDGGRGMLGPGGSESSSSSSLAADRLVVPDPDSRLFLRSDSDIEPEVDPPDWRSQVSQERLGKMKPREQKRQDVINELFHTERNHVRNIRILDSVFRKPLIESGLMSREMIDRLFPNLEEVLTVHQSYSMAMREKSKRGFPIGPLSDLLEGMFLESAGERLIAAAATFTQNQKFTIEELKKCRAREPRLEQFLAEQEKRPECRRLQLQDQLPSQHQRLVKYPLLIEQLAKHQDPATDKDEIDRLKIVSKRAHEITMSVDKLVADAQNVQRLTEIQAALDTSGLEKMGLDDPICREYRNLDLTQHRLLHEGKLMLNLSGDGKRSKQIPLQVLLLEDSIMFIQKQDEKYLLKFHGSGPVGPGAGREEARRIHAPVIKFGFLLVRPVATNKRAFYLINNTNSEPQLNELVASSPAERSTWLNHISEASNKFRSRDAARRSPGRPFTGSTSMVNMSAHSPAGGPKAIDEAKATNRSQSFNGNGNRKDSIQFRPLPTPPPPSDNIQADAESIADKIAKLTMKDLEIARALEEKQRIIADIFQIPPEEYDSITDIVAQHEQKADAKDVLLTAITQADNLDRYISSALKVEESSNNEDNGEREVTPPAAISSQGRTRLASPPTDRLLQITESLKSSLRALLGIMQEEEEENEEEEDECRYDDLSAAAEFSAWGIRPAESVIGPRSADSVGGRTGDISSPWGPRNLDAIHRSRDMDVRSRSRPSSYLSLGSDNADLLSEDGNRSSEGGGSLAQDFGEMPRLQLIPTDNDNDKGRPLSPSADPDTSNNTIKDKTPTNEDDIDNADILNHNTEEVDNNDSSGGGGVEEIGQIDETTTASSC